MKVSGKCGSVAVRIIPAPRGTGLVAAHVSTKILEYAGVKDVFTSTTGHSRTLANFAQATFQAIIKTYGYLSPDRWEEGNEAPTPLFEKYSSLLRKRVEA